MTPEQLKKHTIAIVKGNARTPERFWSRALCPQEELPQLIKEGWLIDNGRFALKPESFK